jgi:hypothetical protein
VIGSRAGAVKHGLGHTGRSFAGRYDIRDRTPKEAARSWRRAWRPPSDALAAEARLGCGCGVTDILGAVTPGGGKSAPPVVAARAA